MIDPMRYLSAAALLAATLAPARYAHADSAPADGDTSAADEDAKEDAMPPPGYVPGHRQQTGLGLSPHAPGGQTVLPGGVAPSFGAPLRPAEGGKFDFHGYVQAGGRSSFAARPNHTADQSSTVWHGDPIVPRGNVFENVNVVPYTWAELRFSYSRPTVTANVSIGAWSLGQSQQASGAFMPNSQLWFRDAFLSYVPTGLGKLKVTANIGVYEDRYGAMAEYSNGQYGAPLIATIPGVGETLYVGIPIGDFELKLEHGIKSSFERPPTDVPTGPANNWPKPWEGQTFVNHAHVGLDWKGIIRPTLHYISAFARDDTGDNVALGGLRAGYADYRGGIPMSRPDLDHADGSLRILAADLRFALRRFGYLYMGVSHTSVDHVRTVSNAVMVQNAGGGRDLMDRYFGRNNDQGRGTLLLAGAEYTVSLGELLRYPGEFWGEGPDLRVSLYGMYAHITSEDPARDGENKYKFGGEGTYSVLPWLALSGRLDRSVPYVSRPRVPLYPTQNDNAFSVATLKAVLRSDWQAREAITVQYSRFFYRPDFHLVSLNAGGQVSNVTSQPDEHLLAIYGTLWW